MTGMTHIPPMRTIKSKIVWHQHWLDDAVKDGRKYDMDAQRGILRTLRRWLKRKGTTKMTSIKADEEMYKRNAAARLARKQSAQPTIVRQHSGNIEVLPEEIELVVNPSE